MATNESISAVPSDSNQESALGDPHRRAFRVSAPLPLPRHLSYLALLLTLEILFLSIWLDTGNLHRTVGLTGALRLWGSTVVRSLVVMAVVFAGFSFVKLKKTAVEIFAGCAQTQIDCRYLSGHFIAMAAFCGLSANLFTTIATGTRVDLLTLLWLICGGSALVLGTNAFLPAGTIFDLTRRSGSILVYAFLAGLAANPLAWAADQLWTPATGLTFRLVRMCLEPFIPELIVNPVTKEIGTRSFLVQISRQCSGLEGAGLMILFGVLWLWFLRDEIRVPRALLLIPAGLVLLYLLNTVRIATLILIGNAGAPNVALGGFHSQAGWIAFNGVAFGILIGTRHVSWLNVKDHEASGENLAAPYLVPFLAIVVASMVSRATSGKFEWSYPFRFFAAGAALWMYRRKYAELNWRCGWLAPLIGAVSFVLWLALHRFAGVQPDNGIAAGLHSATPGLGAAWLIFRVLAAIVTVPLAEELAFRGFLIRRIVSPDFQSLSMQTATPLSIGLSAFAFGLMHGSIWMAGIVVGVLYAAALLWRGRIGDAVVAHVTTNALLAAWVLFTKDWSWW